MEDIRIKGISESEGGGEGGTAPESPKVELLVKVLAKSSALSTEEIAKLQSLVKRS